jgi:UDP:flavonoid glycosyltransferase YjiC (YdhE family)
MPKKVLLFAPAAYSLAETSRMVEIAKGVARHPQACMAFEIRFVSEGGEFEEMIEKNGWPIERVEPRLTPEKIKHIMSVNDEEEYSPTYTGDEMIAKVAGDLKALEKLKPTAIVTGSYLSMPLSAKVAGIPLVWTVQSTWLPGFFSTGAGTTDDLKPRWLKRIVDAGLYPVFKAWMWYGFIHPVNLAAKHYGVDGFHPVFEFFQQDMSLVAEAPGFSDIPLPARHFNIGALIPRGEFTLPPEVTSIPRDLPRIYFAMGSSGVDHVVADLIESFRDKPYRVIAPVKWLIKDASVDVPENVIVTDWLPALEANRMADLALIHGGAGTVQTAALAGKPTVGVGMQPEQVANISCLVRKGCAIRVAKSKNAKKMVNEVLDAIARLLVDDGAKQAAADYAASIAAWEDGSYRAAEKLLERYG